MAELEQPASGSGASPASTRILSVLGRIIVFSSPGLPLGRDGKALVETPAEGARFLVRAAVQLAGNPDEPVGRFEVVTLCEPRGTLCPRDVVHGSGDHQTAADIAPDDGARCGQEGEAFRALVI